MFNNAKIKALEAKIDELTKNQEMLRDIYTAPVKEYIENNYRDFKRDFSCGYSYTNTTYIGDKIYISKYSDMDIMVGFNGQDTLLTKEEKNAWFDFIEDYFTKYKKHEEKKEKKKKK